MINTNTDGFTQSRLINVNMCDGCERHCKYSATLLNGRYYPALVNQRNKKTTTIIKYIDKSGEMQYVNDDRGDSGLEKRAQAISLAREITRLCDHYKQR